MRNILFTLLLFPITVFGQIISTGDGLWSDVVPYDGTDHVYIDHEVIIDGVIDISHSIIVRSGGSLRATTGGINFHVQDDTLFDGDTGQGLAPQDVGLWVQGTVDFNGPEVTSWVSTVGSNFQPFEHGLERGVSIGPNSATLASIPVGWQVGDTIIVTTEQGLHEQTFITSINGTALTYDPVSITGYELRYQGKSVAPKIGNLSRGFTISSAGVTESDQNRRAHVAFMAGSTVNIQNVEFKNLGPRGKLGRYPIHMHRLGTTTATISGNSVRSTVSEGGNRAIVIHATQGANVSNNIVYRAQGHAIFMEEGSEYNNQVIGNLTIDVQGPEELDVQDGNINPIFPSVSERTNHYWLRTGNIIRGNVAVGENDETPKFAPMFGEMHGMAIVKGDVALPAVVEDTELFGAGRFGAWSLADTPVTFRNLTAAYSRIAGWYPVGQGDRLEDSWMVMSGEGTVYDGGIFTNTSLAYADRVTVNGYRGIHLHYFGKLFVDSSHFNSFNPIVVAYWDQLMKMSNTELIGAELFSDTYPRVKRPHPVPIIMETTTYNGSVVDGAYVRHPVHSKFFETVGSSIGSGIQVNLADAIYYPIPFELENGVNINYVALTPPGGDPDTALIAQYPWWDSEADYNDSVSEGFKGYPFGMPAGQYTRRWYVGDSNDGVLSTDYVREDILDLGAAPPPNQPPTVAITGMQDTYLDTDQLPGEPVSASATWGDTDGTVVSSDWVLNGTSIGSGQTIQLNAINGPNTISITVTDDDGATATDTHNFQVDPPPATMVDPVERQAVIDLINQLLINVENL